MSTTIQSQTKSPVEVTKFDGRTLFLKLHPANCVSNRKNLEIASILDVLLLAINAENVVVDCSEGDLFSDFAGSLCELRGSLQKQDKKFACWSTNLQHLREQDPGDCVEHLCFRSCLDDALESLS